MLSCENVCYNRGEYGVESRKGSIAVTEVRLATVTRLISSTFLDAFV